MPTDATVRRILDAALELFNERGVGVVSTRAVAERAGVSSGNLHYHFANKEALVRALLARREELTDPVWRFPDGQPSIAGVERMLRANLRIAWQYRFLNRELVTFALDDPGFRLDYAGLYERRIDQLRALLNELVELGLVDLTPAALEAALVSGWVLSENWLVHLQAMGLEVTEERIAEGARLVMAVLDRGAAAQAPLD